MIMKKFFFGLVLFILIGCSKDATVAPLSPEDQLIKDIAAVDQDQLKKDIATIDLYLTAAGTTAISDPTGLRYVVTTVGTGVKPTLANKVTVKYTGKLMSNGAIFDQSSSATFTLSSLIVGWRIGFPLLNKGSKADLYVPSGYAYGVRGAPPAISANANLIFKVELIDVTN